MSLCPPLPPPRSRPPSAPPSGPLLAGRQLTGRRLTGRRLAGRRLAGRLFRGSALAQPAAPAAVAYRTALRDAPPVDTVPAPLSAHGSDFTGAIAPPDAARAQDPLLALKSDHGIDAHLVTHTSVAGIEDTGTVAGRLGWIRNLEPGWGTQDLVILATGPDITLQGGEGFESGAQPVFEDTIRQMVPVAGKRGVWAALAAQMTAHLIRDDKKDTR